MDEEQAVFEQLTLRNFKKFYRIKDALFSLRKFLKLKGH